LFSGKSSPLGSNSTGNWGPGSFISSRLSTGCLSVDAPLLAHSAKPADADESYRSTIARALLPQSIEEQVYIIYLKFVTE